jgi:CubicO group peptidase (beta-lactamase class C family)
MAFMMVFGAATVTYQCYGKMNVRRAKILSVLVMIAVFLGSFLVSYPNTFAHARQAQSVPSLRAKIDAIFGPLVDGKSPGMAVLVVQNGRTIFERGYGRRDLHGGAKIDEQTNFRLASCTKQFTAMAIMLLVHDGKLRYDSKLTDVFPEFPGYGRAITIRNLLNHTGGLQDYETLMEQPSEEANQWNEKHQIHDVEVFKLLEQTDHGMFTPGTQWYYSNSGYVVLGLVVSKISGMPFREFLRQRIFEPLNMNHTVMYERGKNEILGRAYGHTKTGARWTQTDQSSTSATLGDGGIYSSLEDLAKWDEALGVNKLLSGEEMQPAYTAVTLADGAQPRWPAASDYPAGTPAVYGFGWFLDPYRGHSRTWHYGETMGFRSYIVRFAKDGLTVLVLCNRTDVSPEKLALQVADLFLNGSN